MKTIIYYGVGFDIGLQEKQSFWLPLSPKC